MLELTPQQARAFAEMKKYKFGADFLHPEFKRFVYAFKPETTVTPVPAPAASWAISASAKHEGCVTE